MKTIDYWEECICLGEEHCGLTLTVEQRRCLAESVEAGFDNYDLAFYTPPSSDRMNAIESDWRSKYESLQREFDLYRSNAETAVKNALKMKKDVDISIDKHGEVSLW